LAFDRFVLWRDKKPSKEDIGTALFDYIGHLGNVGWSDDGRRWFVTFQGKSSHPQEHLLQGGPTVTMREERVFEVYLGDVHINVATRDQSPLVNAIADGFVRFAVEFWKARYQQD
jgi:hypothetical protein